ncbi:unnamed protein product [Lactuca saligna]|uniref:Uncharacterized protein n=1 Tax=Lactuca saligna TaxID=75948 RepID=A0AA35ZU68_LACSI|nr:unnamed protein product [Lactuca saligna]
MEYNVVGDASIMVNEDNRGREEIRHGASKGCGKSKDMWGSFDKTISEVENSLDMLHDRVEYVHQQVGVMTSDNEVMQDNVKGAINKLGGDLRLEMCGLQEMLLGEVAKLHEQV